MKTPGTPKRQSLADFQDTGWHTGLWRSLLIAALAASAMTGPLALWTTLTGRPNGYVLVLALLAALLGVSTTARLGRPEWRNRRGLAFRLGELLLLGILARMASWIVFQEWPTSPDARLWLRSPGAFFDPGFVAASAMLAAAWCVAVLITSDFLDLAIQPDEVAAQEQHDWGTAQSTLRLFRPTARGDILGRFAARWIAVGTVLVSLAALSRVSISTDSQGLVRLGVNRLGVPPPVLGGLLAYFVSGLLLLGDGRLAVLRGRWYNQRVTVAPSLLARWHANTLLVVLLAAGVALVLPLGTTNWLATALEWFIALLMRLAMLFVFALTALLTILFYPLRWLFGEEIGRTPPPLGIPQSVPSQTEAATWLPEWLGGALVWAILIVIAGYLLINFIRTAGIAKMAGRAGLPRVRLWWRARRLRIRASLRAGLVRARMRLRSRQPAPPPALLTPTVRLSTLAPREQVRFFYLKVIGRAAERGIVRAAHVTPLEFGEELENSWPDADEDVRGLTAAFLEARYAAVEIDRHRSRGVQEVWRRVMRALRRPAGVAPS